MQATSTRDSDIAPETKTKTSRLKEESWPDGQQSPSAATSSRVTLQLMRNPNNDIQRGNMGTQQTTTHDFTCSVSEFTSSTGSIHVFPYVNLLDFVNKFGVLTFVYREIKFFT